MNKGERQRTAAAIAVLGEGQPHARKMMKLVVSIWMKNCLGKNGLNLCLGIGVSADLQVVDPGVGA